MKRLKPAALRDYRLSRLLFVMCWLAYAAAYVGRLNLSAAIATIVDADIMNKAEAGIISTVFFFCYGAGQIVMGFIADKLNARRMIGIGLCGSALLNLCMTIYPSPYVMAPIWGLNGILQSMLWAPILYIITNELCESTRVRAGVLIASSPLAGTLCAYAAAGFLSKVGWRGVFVFSSVVLLAAGIAWFVVVRIVSVKSPEMVEVDTAARAKKSASTSDCRHRGVLVTSGIALMLLPVMLHGMLKEGISTWVPTMIGETYGSSPALSIFISMILPIINLSGVFFAMFIYDKLTKKHEILSAALVMTIAIVPLVLLSFMGKMPMIASVVLLAAVTTLMHGFNHLLLTMASMKFGSIGMAATMTGMLNSVTYLGSAISGYGFGAYAESFGWAKIVTLWIVIAVVAAAVSYLAVRSWTRFNSKL